MKVGRGKKERGEERERETEIKLSQIQDDHRKGTKLRNQKRSFSRTHIETYPESCLSSVGISPAHIALDPSHHITFTPHILKKE
jgi:hypothetical protein